MTSVLIADDHTLVRKGLIEILQAKLDLQRVDEAKDGEEAIAKAGAHDYDIVLLDIALPGRSGIDVLKQLRSLKPKLPVLILSMYPEEQYAVRALRAGASGYLTKESAPDELIEAVQKIALGGRYITSSLAEKLALEMSLKTGQAAHESLSDREYQVMCMIASGRRLKEIAEALTLSVKTISTYRARILKKMQLSNNAQLTHYAIKNGLVG